MTRNLKNTVGRRIKNRLACAHVFISEFGDDRRAGRMTIAKDAGEICLLDQFLKQFRWKCVYELREVAPFEKYGQARNFPVPAGRIFAGR